MSASARVLGTFYRSHPSGAAGGSQHGGDRGHESGDLTLTDNLGPRAVDAGRGVWEKRRGWTYYPPLDPLSVFDMNAQIAAIPRRLSEPRQIDPNAIDARPTEPRTATPI